MKQLGKSIQVISIILIINLSILYSLPNITANGSNSVKKLLLVHGFNGNSVQFGSYNLEINNILGYPVLDKYPTDNINDFVGLYGSTDNIKSINYYSSRNTEDIEFQSIDLDTPIETIAYQLKEYIKRIFAPPLGVDTVVLDIVAHSMGGLVVRCMVKFFYQEIKDTGITINHVATIATPNHGTLLGSFSIVGDAILTVAQMILNYLGLQDLNLQDVIPKQMIQMAYISVFLNFLNYDDDTPYSKSDVGESELYISWSTFAGLIGIPPLFWEIWGLLLVISLINPVFFAIILASFGITFWISSTDGLVDCLTVPLGKDATNYGPYQGINHDGMLIDLNVLEDVFNELRDIRPSKDAEFSDTKMNQKDSSSNNVKISTDFRILTDHQVDPTSVTMVLDGTSYPMQQDIGSENTFTTDIALEDGSHEYYFTALDTGGNSYTSNVFPLQFVDDDILPPEITIEPDQICVSDEETMSGIPIDWQITDLSGISSASVKIAGDTVASYGMDDSISDSYTFTNNIPGVYPIEITACDNDNDPNHNPQAGPDQLEITQIQDITIYDDDTTPPMIDIDYEGSNWDNNPGNWEINVNVADGDGGIGDVSIWINGVLYINDLNLNGIPSKTYSIPVPANPNGYTVKVTAKNNDRDWEGDQESCTVTDFVEIVDDDTTRPVIERVEYNPTIYDSDESFHVDVWASDSQSGIDSVYGIFFQQNDGFLVDGRWEITIINTHSFYLEEGLNHFVVVALDGDMDRPGDQSVISKSCPITVIDEDMQGPATSVVGPQEILFAQESAEFTITAADPSGISSVDVWVQCGDEIVWRDSVLVDSNDPSPVTVPYSLPIEKEDVYSLFRKPFTLYAQAWDNDNDRRDDSKAGEIVSYHVEPDDITPPLIKLEFTDFEVHIGEGIEYFFTTTAEDPESGIDPNGITIHLNQNLYYTTGTSSILIDNTHMNIAVLAEIYNVDTTHGQEDRELGIANLEMSADALREYVLSQFLNETFAILFGLYLHPEYWMDSGYYYRDLALDQFMSLNNLVVSGEYQEAYNCVLFDLKPKLTGFTTDENEVPWSGDGVSTEETWIVYAEGRQQIRVMLNSLMHELRLLAFGLDSDFIGVIQYQLQDSIDAIVETPDEVWVNIAYRQVTYDAFSQIQSQISAEEYNLAYQFVLTIKFHLTGLVTDELNQPWLNENDSLFNEAPWLSDPSLVSEVESVCNRILNELYILIHGIDIPHENLLKSYIVTEIGDICTGILESPGEIWIPRGGFRYQTDMIDKMSGLQSLIASRNFAAAYDMALYDIKPKLTGYMTDENGIPWSGDGIFDRPWILNPATREEILPGIDWLLSILRQGVYGPSMKDINGMIDIIETESDYLLGTSDALWRNPAPNLKNALSQKLEEVKVLILSGEYSEAYDKLLHDIKPKLTGLKVDEEGNPWGNGIFNNPWVTDSALQAELGIGLDALLSTLRLWAFGPSDVQCESLIAGIEGGKQIMLMINVQNWRVFSYDMFEDYNLLEDAIEEGNYAAAYDLILYGFKPKLTGNATDEFGVAWNESGVLEHLVIAYMDIPDIAEQMQTFFNQFLYVLKLNI